MHGDGDGPTINQVVARRDNLLSAALALTFVAISGSSTPPTLLTGGSIFSTSTRSNSGSKRFAIASVISLHQLLAPAA